MNKIHKAQIASTSKTLNEMIPDDSEIDSQEMKCPETPEEINDFIEKHQKLIERAALTFRGYHDFEDLVQLARIGFWRGLESFDRSRKNVRITTYAYKAAQNEILMYLRGQDAKKRSGTNVSLEIAFGGTDKDNGSVAYDNVILNDRDLLNQRQMMPEEITEANDVMDCIYGIIGRMGDIERDILLMSLNGIPQAAIADYTHLSQATVSKRVNVALAKLKYILVTRYSDMIPPDIVSKYIATIS